MSDITDSLYIDAVESEWRQRQETSNLGFNYFHGFIDGVINVSNCNVLMASCTLVKSASANYTAAANKTLAKITHGAAWVKNASIIFGSIDVKDGNIDISDSIIMGNVVCTRGNVVLSSSRSTINLVKNIPSPCVVYGDLNVGAGRVAIFDTRIYGTVNVTGNSITIGQGAFVRHLTLQCVSAYPPLSRVQTPVVGPYSCPIWRDVNGVNAGVGSATTQYQKRALSRVTQFVTLGAGAVLQGIDFTGDRCVITLGKNARYEGYIAANMTVIVA